MLKKSLALLSAAIMLLGLCACNSNNSFNAKDLLQTNLDILYKGSYTTEALANCDISQAEAERMYNNSVATEVSYFCRYFDINEDLLSDEAANKLQDMYRKIYSGVQYTVGKANKTDSGYTVELSVRPRLVIQDFLAKDADTIMDSWQQKMDAGELDLLDDTEREEVWANAIITAVCGRAESLNYADTQTLSVHIIQDADGYYSISDEDMETIDRLMIEY